jgi:hypothetical protein
MLSASDLPDIDFIVLAVRANEVFELLLNDNFYNLVVHSQLRLNID